MTRTNRGMALLGGVMLSLLMVALFGSGGPQDAEPVEAPPPEPEIMVVVRYATEEEEAQRDRETVEAMAQTIFGEAGICSIDEQAAVAWCILNRVDSPEFPNDPLAVVQQAGQFDGYSPEHPIDPDLVALAEDVIGRWELEKTAVGSVGRVLPADYLYFDGDGRHNYFRQDYIRSGETWDWNLASPYGG